MTVKKTQAEKILGYLSTGRHLSVARATTLGVTNLSARIDELRKDGWMIYTNKRTMKGGVNRGRRVTAYRLDDIDQMFV